MQCTVCKGSGTQHLTVRGDTPSGKTEHRDIPCVWCDGTGEISEQVRKNIEIERNMWCNCHSGVAGGLFYPDCGHPDCPYGIKKHHYHCPDCGKVTQIG